MHFWSVYIDILLISFMLFSTEEKTPGNYTFKFDSSILKIFNLTKINRNENSLLFVISCYM